MNISITINDSEIQAKLKHLAGKLANLEPVMARIGKWYESRVAENFANESDPDGVKWKPLSGLTMMLAIGGKDGFKKGKGKAKTGAGYLNNAGRQRIKSKSLLFASGDLLNSIHNQADSHSVTIGTKGAIPYAAIHQFGGTIYPKGKALWIPGFGPIKKAVIPARPYLFKNPGTLSERDRVKVLEILDTEIAKLV